MLMTYLIVIYSSQFPGQDGPRVRQTVMSAPVYRTRFGRLVSLGHVWTGVQPLTGVPSGVEWQVRAISAASLAH